MTATASRSAPRFESVVLDVDSTIAGLEGIDWLARQRGEDVAVQVHELTTAAMEGRMDLEQVYAARLEAIRATRNDVELLGRLYLEHLAPGVKDAVRVMQDAGVRVVIVSGGLRPALLALGASIGVEPHDVHAVDLKFGEDGAYLDFDRLSPLATQEGKREAVRALQLPGRSLMVGDGSTDLAAREAVSAFVAFTGFVRREAVISGADFVVNSFEELLELVLGGSA